MTLLKDDRIDAGGRIDFGQRVQGREVPPPSRPDLPIEVGDGGFTWVCAGNSFVVQGASQLIDRAGRAFATDGKFLLPVVDAGSSTLVPIATSFPEPITSLSATCLVHGATMSCLHQDGGTTDVADVLLTSDDGFISTGVTTRGELVDDEGVVLTTNVLPGSNRHCQAWTDGGIACGPSQVFAAPGPVRRDTFLEGGGCFVTPQFEAWCFWSGVPQRMPLPFGVRLVSGNLNRGCAVIGNNGVRCWGLGSRFRSVALDATLTQVSVARTQNDVVACALTEAGRVFCWGNNDFGGLGIAPYDSSFIVPLE